MFHSVYSALNVRVLYLEPIPVLCATMPPALHLEDGEVPYHSCQ